MKSSGNGTVAIIGGGPSGIVVARYLLAQGFKPTIFELSDNLGGQWHSHSPNSGVWPSMRTNTSRVMTRFSDLDYEPGVAMYPTNQEVHAYLHRYAETFQVKHCVRLQTRVQLVEPEAHGYRVTSQKGDTASSEHFDYVVVASGRYNKPFVPAVSGLEGFSGKLGARHSFYYKDPEAYRGARVLVAGCAISSLEIASDLAMLGAERVVTSYRRQRYVLPKLVSGVPADHVFFTRWAAEATEVFPQEMIQLGLKAAILQAGGSPEQYGAMRPDPDVMKAGITLSQHFLPLVAEKRIEVLPWIRRIDGQRVTFENGVEEDFDAILFGTGFDLSLPFLSEEIRRNLRVDDYGLDLHRYTFTPEFDGLAFMGLQDQIGPYFPVVELQARWIAYAWSRKIAAPTLEEMRRGVRNFQPLREARIKTLTHLMAIQFSREIGTEPNLENVPELTRALMFGPLAPVSFRISGPDALPDAEELFAKEASCFGSVPGPELTPAQNEQLRALQQARRKHIAAAS